MPYKDPERQRAAGRVHMQKKRIANPPWHAAVKRQNRAERIQKRSVVRLIKQKLECLLCGETDPDKLHFHHVLPGMKVDTVANLLSNRAKLCVILREMEKCVCLCSGCHKELQDRVQLIVMNLREEPWFRDWGVEEALEWVAWHPQNGGKKKVLEVLKGVFRNCQRQDHVKFREAVKLLTSS